MCRNGGRLLVRLEDFPDFEGKRKNVVIIRLVVLGFFLALVVPAPVRAGALFPPAPAVQPGSSDELAPDFGLPDLEGNSMTLSDQRGKVVLLTFWASWCPPCRQEMPSLNRLFLTLGGPDFTVLGVNIETRSAGARSFAESFELAFPILLDTENRVSELYGVFNIPQSYLIDKEGRILQRFLGYHDWMAEGSLERLRSLLRKP